MSRGAWAWALVGLLAVGLAVRLVPERQAASGFATLPILVPASLEYEARMRVERGQPAPSAPLDAAAAAQAVLDRPATPDARANVQALRDERLALLDLRNRRHALNVRIMDVGLDVARELTPEQWAVIDSQRDALKARAEAATFGRVLQGLSEQGQGRAGAGPSRGLPD